MNFLTKTKNFFADYKKLLRSVPAIFVTLFTVSVVMMNLLANKTIVSQYTASGDQWLGIDGGILVAWLSFLCMDIITKHYGPKAATKISIFALAVNLLACGIFAIAAAIPYPSEDLIVQGFNEIFGGTWFILLSSSIAFIISAFINNFLNWGVGTMFKKNPDGKAAYYTRTYVSTMVGQFCDNFIFNSLVFLIFAPIFWGFSWTLLATFTCALVGAVVELLCEVVFSPIGYRITRKWKEENVGKEYLESVG